MFRKKTETGWLVVDFRDDAVGLAHVVPTPGAARVMFCEERPWSADDPATLEKIAREFRAERFQCTTLMNPASYQILLVEAPPVKADELKAAVRWRIKDLIDYHLDDAVVDVLDIPPPEAGNARGHMMYAIASNADAVKALINRFESARLPLQVIDIPDIALRNIAVRLERGEKGVIMVSFGPYGGYITFSGGGELYLTRRVDISAIDLGNPDSDARDAAIERAALEIQRSLDHFDRQFNYVSLDRVVVVPIAGATGLVERIAASVVLPVEVFALDQVIDTAGVPALSEPDGLPKWLMSIGAGLRVESRAL